MPFLLTSEGEKLSKKFRITQVDNNFHFLYLAALIPIVLHLWLVNRLSVNVPYIDDYTFLVDCLKWQVGNITLNDYFGNLFHPHGPHGEHIILFARLAVLLDYWIEGNLNFRTLFIVGNLLFIGTVFIIFRLAHQGGVQPLSFLAVTLVLFQPQAYETTTTWAICTLQHIPALFFAFLAFELMSRPSRRAFLLSLPIAFFAVFSNGNGLIVLAIGLLIILAIRSRFKLIVWGGVIIICLSIYIHVHHQSHSTEIGGNLTHPLRVLAGLFVLVGSVGLPFTKSLITLSLVGLTIVGLSSFVVVSGIIQFLFIKTRFQYIPIQLKQFFNRALYQNIPFLALTACFLYTLITLLSAAFARSFGWYNSLLLPRYIWYAAMMLAIIFLLVQFWLKPYYRALAGRSVFFFSLIFCGFSYWSSFGEMLFVRQLLLSDITNWHEYRILVSLPANTRQHDHFYSDILAVAQQKGVYRLPLSLDKANKVVANTLHTNPVTNDSSFVFGERKIKCLTIDPDILKPQIDKEIYLVAKSDKHKFMWPVNQSRTKIAQYLVTGKSDWSAAMVWIYEDQIPLAFYQFYLAWPESGRWYMIPTIQTKRIGSKLNY